MAVTIKKVSLSDKVRIFRFGAKTDGDASMKNTLGGKGANLSEMSGIGLPIPSGFIIPCDASVAYMTPKITGQMVMINSLQSAIERGFKYLTETFGYLPLMSVRSGARVSMPGMMDTILNVGLTSESLPHWREKLGDKAALDSYRRLIQMYSSVALGVPMEKFEHALSEVRDGCGVESDSQLEPSDLERVISKYFSILDTAGVSFPDSVTEQVMGSIIAVFKSWTNPRAVEYRKIHGIPDDWGTAVTVQSMVFGNMNDQSATGVVFTRDPSTGVATTTGEFLINAQGEDVVAGIRTPQPIGQMEDWNPMVLDELLLILERLENHYKDMQDVEFTVENGKLYILQTRSGKRSAQAAFQIAYDMACEGLISNEVALHRVTQEQLLLAMSDRIDPKFNVPPHLVGIAGGGSIVTGAAVFSSADAVNCTTPCILVTKETDPDDIAGMNASVGILTATGGLTSHAAVVARGMNKSCVVGCTDMVVSPDMCQVGGWFATKGSKITIDGSTGNVWFGIDVPVISGAQTEAITTMLSWAVSGEVSKRLDLSASMSLDDLQSQLAGELAKSIYVDTAIFECGKNPATEVQSGMVALGYALESFEGSEIVIDTQSITAHYDAADRIMNRMFGESEEATSAITAKVNALISWSPQVRSKVMAKLSEKDSSMRDLLQANGVRVLGHVFTVSDLLSATGPVEVSPEVVDKVFGGHSAYAELKAMIESHKGVSLSGGATKSQYWYEVLNKEAA